MKQILAWLGCSVLAAGMAVAQDANGSASGAQDQNTQTRTQSTTTQTNTVRGCLSGAPGNYTITGQDGTQWTVTGDDATLRNSVGREVEIRFAQNLSSEESNQGPTTTRTTRTVQASRVKALSDTCSTGGAMTAPQDNMNPGSTSGTSEPQSPRMMSMLIQQSAPGQAQTGAAAPPQASPPVTSQTSATSASPTTGANSQVGASGANNSQAGNTAGQGIDNQGANGATSTSPNAAPTSPNSATPSSNTQQSQGNCSQGKPLYECQATDIPWANASGGNNGTANQPH